MGLLQKLPRKTWSFLNVINRIVRKDPYRIILYSNMGFRDNVRAVFDYLIQNGYNKRYKIIVSLNDHKKYSETPEKNVEYVSPVKGLFKFFRCKYCYYCFGKYPIKPPKNQFVFNLFHGMPLKRIGNMVPGCEKIDYNYFSLVLCTSEYFRDIIKRSFNASDEQIAICGQPRTDEMLAEIAPEDEMNAKAELIDYDSRFSKMILWLPTYRDGRGSELDILETRSLNKLDKMLSDNGYVMLVKLHPLSTTDPYMASSTLKCIRVIDNDTLEKSRIGFYSLLAMSHALITDYSSVFFDYVLLDRPIGFVIDDIKEYSRDRGFVFDDPLSNMPGELIRSSEDFLGFVKDVIDGRDKLMNYRRMLCSRFNAFNDADNCKRVVSVIDVNERRLKRKNKHDI